MRNSIDSVSAKAIIDEISAARVDRRGLMAGVYANGKFKADPGQVATLEQSGVQVFHIDVNGTAAEQAAVLDFERGDVQRPATVTNWVRFRGQHYGDPIVYCNRSSLGEVIPAAAAAGHDVGLWVADLLGNPPLHHAVLGLELPPSLYLLGCQYVFDPQGRDVDLSIFWRDNWHPAPPDRRRPDPDIVNAAYMLLGRRAARVDNVSRETDQTPTPSEASPVTTPDQTDTPATPAPMPGADVPITAPPADPAPAEADPAAADPAPAKDDSAPSDPAPADQDASAPPVTSEASDESTAAPAPDPAPSSSSSSATSTPDGHSPADGASSHEGLVKRLRDGVAEAVELLHEAEAHVTADHLGEVINAAVAILKMMPVNL